VGHEKGEKPVTVPNKIGGDEPPPRFSVRRWVAVRECLVRSTVPVGGGRSPLSLAIMTRLVTLLVLVIGVCSCSTDSRTLGHGYRIVPRAVDMSRVPNAFEGLAHYTDLYYRSHRLGTVGEYSISPSGRYAIFQDDGKTLLFDRSSGETRDVTDGSVAIAKSFAWSESAGTVGVQYYDGHSPSKIEILK